MTYIKYTLTEVKFAFTRDKFTFIDVEWSDIDAGFLCLEMGWKQVEVRFLIKNKGFIEKGGGWSVLGVGFLSSDIGWRTIDTGWRMVETGFLNLNIKRMKKLTKEEVAKLVVRKGKSTPVRTGVMHLQVGEFLLIEKSDWNQTNGPGQMLSRLAKKTGMEFKLQTVDSDGGGWIVERLK